MLSADARLIRCKCKQNADSNCREHTNTSNKLLWRTQQSVSSQTDTTMRFYSLVLLVLQPVVASGASPFGFPVALAKLPPGGSRLIAENESETESLEVSLPLSQAAHLDPLTHSPLLKDIELLSDMLAEVVDRENPKVHDLYCQLRQCGLDRYVNENWWHSAFCALHTNRLLRKQQSHGPQRRNLPPSND